MSVHIGKLGVDENSISYGQQIEHLRNLIVSYMRALYDDLVYHDSFQRHTVLERNVRDTVDRFIAGNYFVDENALQKWLSKRGNTQQQFQEMRQKVIEMFRKLIYDGPNSMVLTWVQELFEAQRRWKTIINNRYYAYQLFKQLILKYNSVKLKWKGWLHTD